MRELFPGDVIQIKPAENILLPHVQAVDPCYQGCFAIVDKSRKWGIEASIITPIERQDRTDLPAEMPIRLANGTFVYIGVSVYHMGRRDDV